MVKLLLGVIKNLRTATFPGDFLQKHHLHFPELPFSRVVLPRKTDMDPKNEGLEAVFFSEKKKKLRELLGVQPFVFRYS